MTTTMWNEGIAYLMNGTEGCWIEHNGRKVEIVNMCGGRYLCYDKEGNVAGLYHEEWRAMEFLKN